MKDFVAIDFETANNERSSVTSAVVYVVLVLLLLGMVSLWIVSTH